jgi:hypothetical protein
VSTTTRRRAPLAALVIALASLVTAAASPASADPILPVDYQVDATTTLAALNQTVTITGGSFTGQIDLGTGDLTGNLALPPASSTLSLAGLPLATATFEMAPTGPITGHVDLATLTATTTASFNIKLTSLRPTILPFLNLVRPTCRTATPVSLTMSGPINLAGSSQFSGEYAIPRFRDCGLLTTVLNLLIPGDGNTFSATFAPAA